MKKLTLILCLFIFTDCGFIGPEKVITYNSGGALSETEKMIFKRYEDENPGIKIRPIKLPAFSLSEHDMYVTYLSSGSDAADIFNVDIIWIAEFAEAGWLYPLDDIYSQNEKDMFVKNVFQGGYYKEKLYAIPGFSDAGLGIINKKIWKAVGGGEKLPASWDELYMYAGRAKSMGYTGMLFQARESEALICNLLEHFPEKWQMQGDVVTSLIKQKNDWLYALNDFKRSLAYSDPDILKFAESESGAAFTEGKTLYLRNWPFIIVTLKRLGWKWKEDYDLCNVPAHPTLGGWYLVVNKNGKYPHEAAKFLKYLTSFEIQKEQFTKRTNYPTFSSLYFDKGLKEQRPELEKVYQSVSRSRPRPGFARYNEFSRVLRKRTFEFLQNKITAETAITLMLKDIQERLDEDQR